LAVLKNDDVLRERTILGGNVEYNKGRMHLKALGGVIKDETGDQEWSVAGGEIGYEYVKNHKVGVHFSYIDDVDTVRSLGRRLTYSFSLRGNRLFKNVGYYSEFAILDFQDIVRDNGYGFFSGITFSKSRFSGFFEVKSYKDFDNEMNNPPVADRIDEIATLNDTAGARLYLQYTFAEPDITLFVNFGRYREYEDTGNHYYGGFSIEDLWDKFNFSASYGVRDIFYPVKKFDTYIIYQFSDTWSVEMSMKTKRYSDNAYEFQEDDYGFQVNYSPYVSLFVLHQYSHNQVMDLNNFYSGGVKVYLKCGTAIEVSGGTVRGGQICSGGQCFVAPPFKGVKFSLLHTFK
ncbi:MAG: hypothetical protein GY765_26970, partial [bacterium]|nr:hypothetical protein [bacterium]